MIDNNTASVIASVIFAAGILYSKVNSSEKKIDSLVSKKDEHDHRITKVETEVKNLKENLQ